jgi:hypothetical protein
MLEPYFVLDALTTRVPVALENLPDEYGVYALVDHSGQVRYFGVTAATGGGFRVRINNKHVTGSGGYSHKFSHAYNTGRMWRSRGPCALQESRDAKAAKRLRAVFCRKHCKAAYFSVPLSGAGRDYFGELTALEKQIQSIAPPSMRRWERLHFTAEDEPKEMVDALIDELGYSAELRRALERQAELFARRAPL